MYELKYWNRIDSNIIESGNEPEGFSAVRLNVMADKIVISDVNKTEGGAKGFSIHSVEKSTEHLVDLFQEAVKWLKDESKQPKGWIIETYYNKIRIIATLNDKFALGLYWDSREEAIEALEEAIAWIRIKAS